MRHRRARKNDVIFGKFECTLHAGQHPSERLERMRNPLGHTRAARGKEDGAGVRRRRFRDRRQRMTGLHE